MKKFLSKSIMILVLVIMCFTALSLTACSKSNWKDVSKITYIENSIKINREEKYMYTIKNVYLCDVLNDYKILKDLTSQFINSNSKNEYYVTTHKEDYVYHSYCPFDYSDIVFDRVGGMLDWVYYNSIEFDRLVSINLELCFQEIVKISLNKNKDFTTIKYSNASTYRPVEKNNAYSLNTILIPTENIIEIKY